MFDLGSEQLLLIALIVLVIFGATRLPEVGRLLRRGVSRMRPANRQGPRKQTTESRRGLAA
jgi:Sec-independent protein translocase protein TatA